MEISYKAVEAAARAIYESKTGRDGYSTSNHRGAWLNIARHALEAAAPLVVAQALRDEARMMQDQTIRMWLESRADELGPQ